MSPRRSLLIVGAVLGATTLGGCSYLSPQTTATPYAASDGIVAQAGSVGLRNIMVVARAKGAVGQVYGSVVNEGDAPAQVAFSSGAAAPAGFTVQPGQVVNLRSKPQRIPNIPVIPGKSIPVTVTVDGSATELTVPVLDGTLPEYRTLVPTAAGSAKSTVPARPSATATRSGARATTSPTMRATRTVAPTATVAPTPSVTR